MSEPDPKPLTTYTEFRTFLELPAWREIRGHVKEYLSQMSVPMAVLKPGLDDLVERGVNERVCMELARFFFELPAELLAEKEEEYRAGGQWDQEETSVPTVSE